MKPKGKTAACWVASWMITWNLSTMIRPKRKSFLPKLCLLTLCLNCDRPFYDSVLTCFPGLSSLSDAFKSCTYIYSWDLSADLWPYILHFHFSEGNKCIWQFLFLQLPFLRKNKYISPKHCFAMRKSKKLSLQILQISFFTYT